MASFEYSGDTTDFYDDYRYSANQCPGMKKSWGHNAADAVFSFAPAVAGDYNVKLTADFDANLYATTDCNAIASSCLGADQDEKKQGGESLLISLDAEETVFVVVDGAYDEEHVGVYTVSFEPCEASCEGRECGSDGCAGSCGTCGALEVCSGYQCIAAPGLSCDATRKFSKIPYQHKSNTAGFDDSHQLGCVGATAGAGEGAKDVTYRFKSKNAGTFRFALSASFDARLDILGECAGEADSCIAGDEGSAPSVELVMEKGDIVYIVVDGVTVSDSGSYTFNATELCFPQCDGKECGDDGCDGVCGICAAPADLCIEGGICSIPEDLPGNSCALPYAIPMDAELFEALGNTEASWNHYGFGDHHCPGFVGKGGASADQVWFLESELGGDYLVELIPDGFDATIYAVSDCSSIADTCVVSGDGTDYDQVFLSLSPGEGIFIIVDGASNTVNQSGAYEFRLYKL